MGNLENKLNDGVQSIIELANDTFKFIPNATIKDCFPADIYRIVTLDGKDYQLHMNVTIQEI